MKEKYFDWYGKLSWLEPDKYYEEPWSYVCKEHTYDVEDGDDDGWYDIVTNKEATEVRYTIV